MAVGRGVLDKSGFLESCVSAVFVDRADRFGRNSQGDVLIHLRDKDLLLLKVWVLADISGRVELGSTSTVAV
ncbi:MAG: hypothetical protein K0S38_540, partial [Candidatus Paceibacter sp.]|nr:hypothetical protein [Candidatus Paceibacter sp.]